MWRRGSSPSTAIPLPRRGRSPRQPGSTWRSCITFRRQAGPLQGGLPARRGAGDRSPQRPWPRPGRRIRRAPIRWRLVESFVTPFMLNGKTPEGRATMRMHARLHTEPDDIRRMCSARSTTRPPWPMSASSSGCCRTLSHETLCWRLYFMMGAYATPCCVPGAGGDDGGACDSGDFDRAVAEIVPFLCAGLAAP